MSTSKAPSKRSLSEKIFLVLFVPSVILFYLAYKYPAVFGKVPGDFALLGKNLGFWYSLAYTSIVSVACLWVITGGFNPYWRAKTKIKIDPYQRGKFSSILVAQLLVFFLIPQVLAPLFTGHFFEADPVDKGAFKDAHVYLYPGFASWGMALYLFVLIPVLVYFFGKRYCSWFCPCGNLAEAVGITPWGSRWVAELTPRGDEAKKLEWIQVAVMLFSVGFGIVILIDAGKLFGAGFHDIRLALQAFQDLSIDFIFGAILGVGLYPFMGTRIWCRYGCALARFMQLVGSFTKSRFAIVANASCRGLNLCSSVCPMGIDVASYAHLDKKPILGSFTLKEEPCIGCGGCISICPVQALSFGPIVEPVR